MAPIWLRDVVLCRDPQARALLKVTRRERARADEQLLIGTPCPYCQQNVLTVVQGERGPLEVRQGLADADHCLHTRRLES